MIRIRPPAPDAQLLDDEFRRCKDAAYRDRLRIVRSAAGDRPHHRIADDPGTAARTAQRRLNRYLGRGRAGLRPRRAQGAEAKIPADPAGGVRRRVIQGPAARGPDRAHWTHAERAEHLSRPHGIRHPGQPIGHAALPPEAGHPGVSADVPVPAGRPRGAGGRA